MNTSTTLDKSRLNVSTYTNYIVSNHIRENIELKNEVKTRGFLFDKNRYAVLTTHRFLLFENREKYLNKKKPHKNYTLTDYEFSVDGPVLKVLKNEALVKEFIFSSIEIAIHWWESINELKRAPKLEGDETFINSVDLKSGLTNNTMALPKSNNIFTKSVIEDLNSSAFFGGENKEKEKKELISKNDLKNSMSSFCLSFKPKKNKVGFKTDLERQYIVNKDKTTVEEVRRSSLVTENSFISGISKTEESLSDLSDICTIPKVDEASLNSKNAINNITDIKTKKKYTNSVTPIKLSITKKKFINSSILLNESSFSETIGGKSKDKSLPKAPSFSFLKQEGNVNNLSFIPKSKSLSSFSSVSNEKICTENRKLNNIHVFDSKVKLKEHMRMIPQIIYKSYPIDREEMNKQQNENTAEKRIKSSLVNNSKKTISRNVLRKSYYTPKENNSMANMKKDKMTIRVMNEENDNLIPSTRNANTIEHNFDKVTSKTRSRNRSYYFLEKSFRNSSNSSSIMETSFTMMEGKSERMKPSTLIEQLLENRYSKTMLKLSLKEKKETTSFIPKLYSSLDFIMKNTTTNVLVLKILFDKMPKLLRARLNKKDLMMLSKNKGFFGLRMTDPIKEIKILVCKDIEALIEMFNEYYRRIARESISEELRKRKEKYEKEMRDIIKDIKLYN